LITGRALVQTTRHFFPDLNVWLSRLPDTRVQEACTYDRRFLAWWGIHLYLLQLGSRRQLDFELRDGGPSVLANFNRLAETTQTTLPVLGVPLDASGLGGLDALLATVQMPAGVPVGTLAIGKAGATNAGILAVSILANSRPDLRARLREFRTEQTQRVRQERLP